MRARAATPPMDPPAITPVLLEDFAADVDVDVGRAAAEEDETCAVLAAIPREFDERGEDAEDAVDEVANDEGFALVEAAGVVLITRVPRRVRVVAGLRLTAVPFKRKSPFLSSQHASARVPFPQQ